MANKINLPKKNADKKTCAGDCGKEQSLSNFYRSNNKLFDGYSPICKKCLKNMADYNNIESIYEILKQLDIAFFYDYWIKAQESKGDTLGAYIRMANSLPQMQGYTWKDSMFNPVSQNEEKLNNSAENKIINENLKSQITYEIIDRWGNNYTPKQLIDLEKFYNDMKMTHTIVTPQHVKALIMLCKMQLKLDIFLEADDMASFSKLHEQYQKLLQSSGLRPIDKVGGDEATGMRSFSHIFEEVERDGYIKPKKYKVPQDIVDNTILFIENNTRKLIGQQTLIEPPLDTPKIEGIEGEKIE